MPKSKAENSQLGTFGGVFTPSILTILGLILFLRLGFVVGAGGLAEALVIILLASTISILTSVSMSAIATNLKVKGGGVYYIISRTLGLPFGGAIGVVLFAAQAISVGFYCVGFAEGVAGLLGLETGWWPQAIAAMAVVVMAVIAWFGAAWATRFQYVVMILLVAALLSFFIGAIESWDSARFMVNLTREAGWGRFWVLFAIFFPAVTGFTQGVNMSGDLADPAKSIPKGTAYAVGISTLIYILVAILFAAALPDVELTSNLSAMKVVAAWSPVIDAGIISATLSSALASLLGAPRILQSLAKDRVFSFLLPFAEGAGADANPRRGVLLTAVIALAIVALGNLNLIAAVVSMFFVVTYGLLNYATYFEARAKGPSFRPSLRWYDSRISLAGGIVSIGAMLAINLLAGLTAIATVFGIFQYLKRNATTARWADGQRSYHLQKAREHLLAANARAEHPRDWRPQILAFSDNALRRERLLTFAGWIEGLSGLTTVIRILEGNGRYARRARQQAEENLASDIAAKGLKAFPLVVSGTDLETVVPIAVQSAGIGPARINTVLVNWLTDQPEDGEATEYRRFIRNLHVAYSYGCNLLIFDSDDAEWAALNSAESKQRQIDVWWRDNRNGRLMLVLAYLLTRNDAWRSTTIRVVVTAKSRLPELEQRHLDSMLQLVRIPAEVVVVDSVDHPVEKIVATSASASIVFLELGIRRERFVDAFGNDISEILPKLPTAVLVMAAEEVDLSVDPDQGEESERAAAKDAYDDALVRRDRAAEAVEEAAAELAALLEKPEDERPSAELAIEREKLQSALDHNQDVLVQEEHILETARTVALNLGVPLKKNNIEDSKSEASE